MSFNRFALRVDAFFPRVAVELFPRLTNLLAHIGFVCRLLQNFNLKPGRHGTDQSIAVCIQFDFPSGWESYIIETRPSRSIDQKMALTKNSASSHILFLFPEFADGRG